VAALAQLGQAAAAGVVEHGFDGDVEGVRPAGGVDRALQVFGVAPALNLTALIGNLLCVQ
jgi:hypothetical protein